VPSSAVLKGSPELKARLEAIMTVFEPVAARWADEATGLMRHKIRSPTGKMRASLQGYYNNRRGWVEGDWRVTFIDKGTKAHGPRRAKVMRWTDGAGNTIFAHRVRGVRKRPFIRSAATQALRNDPLAKEVIALWNAAGRKGGGYVLGNKALAKRRAQARLLR